MVVPARMVLGDMTAFGLAVAIVLEVIAIGAVILLAARAYERAILRIGAPIKLHRLLVTRAPHRPALAGARPRPTTIRTAPPDSGRPRLSHTVDVTLRGVAVVVIIAGAFIGFGRPVAIGLVVVGLLLLAVRQILVADHPLKRWPRKPAP